MALRAESCVSRALRPRVLARCGRGWLLASPPHSSPTVFALRLCEKGTCHPAQDPSLVTSS